MAKRMGEFLQYICFWGPKDYFWKKSFNLLFYVRLDFYKNLKPICDLKPIMCSGGFQYIALCRFQIVFVIFVCSHYWVNIRLTHVRVQWTMPRVDADVPGNSQGMAPSHTWAPSKSVLAAWQSPSPDPRVM